jgi:hypothetical protein
VHEQITTPLGIALRPFVDPNGTDQVGFVAEIPDMDASMRSSAARPGPRP